MRLKKTKKDIIESIKSVSSKKKNEMFEVDSKVQAIASPSFVDALEMSAKNKQMVIDRMKKKEKERKEFMKQTVERTANKTPKTDDMKKMKMVEKFIKESFKDKLTINENIFTVATKSRAELKKLIENARKHEVKYTIERINEEYRFNYKFESLDKKINEERKYVAGFFSKGKKDSYTEMSNEKWNSLDSDVKVKDLLDMWWNSVRIKGKGIKGEALLYKDCHDGSYELDEEHNSHGEDILNMTVHTHSEYDEDADGYPIIHAKLLSKEIKESIDNGHFWAIVYKQIGDDVEQNDIYDDFDDARADFKYMAQENPKDYEYVVLQEVTIEDGVEDITIIGELRDGELVESKSNVKLTVEKAKNIAYDKLSYGDYKNLMTMNDDYIIDYVSTELVEDKLKDDKRFECEDGKMRTQAEYEKWIKHLKELHEIEEGDLTADELRALENAGALDESKDSTLKEEYALQRSPYKDIIGRHFDYSVDFEFLDIVAIILDRIDFEGDLEDEINVAIDDSLIYIEDQWTVAKFYAPSPADLDWDEVLLDGLSVDIHILAEEIIATKED